MSFYVERNEKEDEGPTDIELDDNDKKIIQLYEIINELIEEQKSRTNDLILLQNGEDEDILTNLEERNDSLLQQIYNELELKERNDDNNDDNNSNSDDDDDDDEDEQDEGWEIYNNIVKNLNNYMQRIAEFIQKLRDDKDLIDSIEINNNDDEINELELVIKQQTSALEIQMKRNTELENALTSVLTEYSNRINSSNDEITALHEQLSNQNNLHSKQLKELRTMYDTKIKQLQNTTANKYKEEVDKLLIELDNNRSGFTTQIQKLSKDMSDVQYRHHQEIIKLNKEKQKLIKMLAERNANEFNANTYNKQRIEKIKNSLICKRTELDIDLTDYNLNRNNNTNTNNINNNYSGYNNSNNNSMSYAKSKYYRSHNKKNKY